MALTEAGRDFIAGALIGTATPLFDNTNAFIGVGDDNGAYVATQTQLEAERNATSSLRKAMDGSYPIQDPEADSSNNKIRFRATFGSADANFHWEEWGIFNHGVTGSMLNRIVDDQGTKASGATWIFEVDLEIQIGS